MLNIVFTFMKSEYFTVFQLPYGVQNKNDAIILIWIISLNGLLVYAYPYHRRIKDGVS